MSDFRREKYAKMPDGNQVMTVVISTEDELAFHFPDFISGARNSGMFVGFDTEWKFCTDSFPDSLNCARIALLKLCNNLGLCLLINLYMFERMPRSLVEFLAIRDITFVGVDISKQLNKLREDYGLEMRTTVELSSIAVEIWRPFARYDVRRIPLEGLDILWQYACGTEPKGVTEELMTWLVDNPWDEFSEDNGSNQLEYAVFPAYAAVKIADKLFDKSSVRQRRVMRLRGYY